MRDVSGMDRYSKFKNLSPSRMRMYEENNDQAFHMTTR
jgi:hypothetical protein